MDPLSSKLIQERQELVRRAEGIKQTAFDESERDLNDSELGSLETLQGRIATIDNQLDRATVDYELNAETQARIAKYSAGAVLPPDGHAYRSAGELLWDVIHQDDRQARERYLSVVKAQTRAAEHMGTVAANTVPVAGDLGGLVPNPVTGPIIDLAWSGMPLLQALNPQPASNPLNFQRPRIVDPDLDTAVDQQAGGKEKAELPSKKFDVEADTVRLASYGSYLNISLQLESFVAGALDLIIGQLNKRLSRKLERLTAAEVLKTTASVPLESDADAAAVWQAIYNASALVFKNTGELATWVAMGPDGWARLGGTTDLNGRPLFPNLGSSSAASLDVSVAGLRPIISPAITGPDLIVGNGAGIEVYLYRFPTLQAVEPSVLGRQVAVASAWGAYRVPTTEPTTPGGNDAKYEAFVKITDTTP